ncbi:hypothetical protein IKE82_01510 [Candidatus Saccharibacteria bacterium]|nr:hypothetical protein [Candidatus Saccharibacteria bacterium]
MQEQSNLSLIQLFFRNKWVRLCLIFDVILVVVLIFILIWQSTKVSIINFNITPLDATISLNGDSKYENGQYSITPGTYNVSISHEGLETKSFTIDIVPQSVVTISTFLPDTDHTFDYYKLRKNYSSYMKLEEIASAGNNVTTDQDTSAESFIRRFQEDYNAFTTKLPIDYSETVFLRRLL